MKQDRLRAIIDQFIGEDRSDDPVVAILCYDVNVAITLSNYAKELLDRCLVPSDAYVVDVDRLEFEGGGKIVFSDNPSWRLSRIDRVLSDDRCSSILRRNADAAAMMDATKGGKAEVEQPKPVAGKPRRKPRSASREASEQL